MIISKQWLEDQKACAEGIAWFESQTETDATEIIKSWVEKKEHLNWANWLMVRTMDYRQRVKIHHKKKRTHQLGQSKFNDYLVTKC